MEQDRAAEAGEVPSEAAGSSATEADKDHRSFVAGLRVGVGLGAATFLLGIAFGSEAVAHGWGTLAPILCSVLVFSGSAQFALLTALAGGAGVVTAVTAAALINARFIPMGIAVAADLRGGRLRRALEGQTVVDASWVAAHVGGGRFDRSKLFGATAVQAPAWVAGTAVGVVLSPSPRLVDTFGLDVVFPAFFLLLLIEELHSSRRAGAAAAAGGAVAAGLVLLVPVGLALIASTTSALIGLVPRRGTGRQPHTGTSAGRAEPSPAPGRAEPSPAAARKRGVRRGRPRRHGRRPQ